MQELGGWCGSDGVDAGIGTDNTGRLGTVACETGTTRVE
jgi:hypothetical protein